MDITKSSLFTKISQRSLSIAVIGLGYVGLPLAILCADADFNVFGIDIDQRKVEQGNRGESYIKDIDSDDIKRLVERKHLHFTDDYSVLANVDVAIICVPTPLDKLRIPDISYIEVTIRQIRSFIHREQLIILESTTYPGTTDELLLFELEKTGLRVGVDFFLAFSPERIDPGNTQFNIRSTPKIVGGITPTCTALAQAFYSSIIEHIFPVSSTKVAEMSKLLENTFRAVNTGLVNEFAIMCDKLNINVWEVIEAAATKPFGFMRFLPGPGLGGHCIPIDPHYLAWKMRTLDYTPRFIELADEINRSMPYYIVKKIGMVLAQCQIDFSNATILILGVAYKSDIEDLRESPALDIIRILLTYKARVHYNDEYVQKFHLDNQFLQSHSLTSKLLRSADCVVVLTNHSYYDAAYIVREARVIVDARNMLKNYNDAKIVRL